MAEPKKPKRPPAGSPDAPLPRLWKSGPEEEPEDEPSEPSKKAKDSKKVEPAAVGKPSNPKRGASDRKVKDSKKPKSGKDGEEKGVLKEETPTFDTHETRQRIRIIAGVCLSGIFLLVGYLVVRLVSPAEVAVQDAPAQDAIPGPPTASTSQPQREEDEARILFERAREVAGNKNTALALSLLTKVKTQYPKTSAANEARDALDRPKQNPPLPLFVDKPFVVARAGDPPAPRPEPAPEPVKVVSASTTALGSQNGARANLDLPANPPEASPVPTPRTSAAHDTPARALPKGFRARQGSEVHESGWPLEIVGDRDGAPMLLVPGGTFIQGRDDAESNEGPSHEVRLGTFYVDRHEVTVRQFALFQKESGPRTERARALAKDPAHSAVDAVEDHPVVMVTARDAKDYADWAGKFLPTEAQWEAAARTPDGRIFPWGPEAPVWNRPRAPRQIDPIMSFPLDVSPYGAFDLAGNAWEWTKDWYDAHYYQQFRTAPADNPAGPVKPRSQQLVVKGEAKDWTVSKREGFKFDTRLAFLGFRCVLQVEGAGNAFEPPPAAAPPGQQAPAPGGKLVVPF